MLRRLVFGAAAVAVVLAGSLAGLRVARAGTVPGLTVAGTDVGMLDEAALRSAIEEVAASRHDRQIEVRRGEESIRSTAADLGYEVDVDATMAAALERGRQANPLAALRDQLLGTFAGVDVALVDSFDETLFAGWVADAGEALTIPPIDGGVSISPAGDVMIVPPEPGETIDADALEQAALAALEGGEQLTVIEVPTRFTTPDISPEQLVQLEAEIQRAVDGPVALTHGDATLRVLPEQMARLLRVRATPVAGSDRAEARLVIDHTALVAEIPAGLVERLQQPPVDARFEVDGDRIRIAPAEGGLVFDARSAAAQLLEVATGPGPRSQPFEGRVRSPDVTTEDLERLGIREQVASFTTTHPCCQGRVTNIHRIADLVSGTIVQSGEVFSLNGHVGRRTEANGFVDGGAISDGEIVEQIGGGVSQFTTTLFNAVFFGGYAIEQFQPHSFYISRYPLGREATLNFDPPIDLRWRNDSPDAVLIHADYTDTEITVRLFSTVFASVETETGQRYGFVEPEERVRESDEVAAGTERVVQAGSQGFSVDFTRQITYVDGRQETERYTTHYRAEPRIVEIGTGDPAATEEPTEEPPDDPPQPETEEPDTDPAPQPPPEPDEEGDPAPPPPTAAPAPEPEPEPTPAPRPTAEPATGDAT